MHQQLWGYKVENKLYLGVGEQKRLNTTDLDYAITVFFQILSKSSFTSRPTIDAVHSQILTVVK